MRLTRMRYGNVPPFTEPVDIRFDERVNVFVGPNATGKSRLLSAIDGHFNKTEASRDWNESAVPGWSSLESYPFELLHLTQCLEEHLFRDRVGVNALCVDRELLDARSGSHANPTPPVIYLGPIRPGLPQVSNLSESGAYGSSVEKTLSGPFSGARLKSAIEQLYAKADAMLKYENEEDLPAEQRKAWRFSTIEEVSHSCAKSVCEELIASNRALNYPTGLDLEFLANQPTANLDSVSINRMLGVATTDTPTFAHIRPADRPADRPINPGWADAKGIYVGDLSSGSQSVLLWIMWLAFKMLNHYEFARGWNEKPAVLLIDEIENHLHPTWQRRVIPALLKHFPSLQIFAATHSPFAIAGLRAGQVHMLKRDAEGVVTASTNERDIIGWTTDEILRTFMGVDEPTDQLTIERANQLRELRGKEDLNDAESAELADLRRLVNEDFISSSTPLEEQRKRYGEMMLAFLQSRQSDQSQDSC